MNDSRSLTIAMTFRVGAMSTVQAALDANASNENGRKIHIVSPEWLETCLEEQKKCREGTYLWEKLDQVASGSKQKKRGKSGGDDMDAGENAGETRKAPQALLGEVFQESTEPFVEERDLRAYEAEIAGEAKARKEREEAEARIKELEKLENAEVPIRVLLKGVGGISESDILLADASQAIVIGFRVAPEDRAVTAAEDKKIEIRRYDIIYQVTDDIKKAVEQSKEAYLAGELRNKNSWS